MIVCEFTLDVSCLTELFVFCVLEVVPLIAIKKLNCYSLNFKDRWLEIDVKNIFGDRVVERWYFDRVVCDCSVDEK